MDQTTALALVPVLLLAAAFVGWCLLDIARSGQTRHLPRWAWALLTLASVPLGGVLYLLLGREQR